MIEKVGIEFEGVNEKELVKLLNEKLKSLTDLKYSVKALDRPKVTPVADNCCNGSCD